MHLDVRHGNLLIILENEKESQLVDEVFGKQVSETGMVSKVEGEVRLADGYGEHYILLRKKSDG